MIFAVHNGDAIASSLPDLAEEYVRPENLSITASPPAPPVRVKSGALLREKSTNR